MRVLILLVAVTAGLLAMETQANTAGDRKIVTVSVPDNCRNLSCTASLRSEMTLGSSWPPALEPITVFLGGTGLMGLGWAVWRRQLFGRPQPVAGQTIVQDRIIRSLGS
jgi:hypothetical protein